MNTMGGRGGAAVDRLLSDPAAVLYDRNMRSTPPQNMRANTGAATAAPAPPPPPLPDDAMMMSTPADFKQLLDSNNTAISHDMENLISENARFQAEQLTEVEAKLLGALEEEKEEQRPRNKRMETFAVIAFVIIVLLFILLIVVLVILILRGKSMDGLRAQLESNTQALMTKIENTTPLNVNTFHPPSELVPSS